jgi:hypothetical protein
MKPLYEKLTESLKRDLIAKAGEPRPGPNTVHGIALSIAADGLLETPEVQEAFDEALWNELLVKMKAGEQDNLGETFDIAVQIFGERLIAADEANPDRIGPAAIPVERVSAKLGNTHEGF